MEETSEQKLADRLKKRDRTAMEELYGLWSSYLYAVCCRYVGDSEKAKDVLQDSFVKIFSSIEKFEYRGIGSLSAWMRKITVNEALKSLRATEKSGFIVLTENIPDIEIPEDTFNLEEIPPSVIQEMIQKLPEGYRTVFNLYVFEDKSHKEIADMLGIRENSSASQLHRAKALLAKWINDYKRQKSAI